MGHRAFNLLLAVLLILDETHSVIRVQHFNVVHGKRLFGHTVDATKALSRMHCCMECMENPVCLAANYNPTTGKCQLCDETPVKYGTQVEVDAAWNMYHVPGMCGNSWIYYGQSCYKFEPFRNNWTGSTDYCATFGARLVEIDDDAENQFVANVSASAGYGGPWLGVNDIVTNGEFMLPSGPPATYLNFNVNEGTSSAEGCVVLSPSNTMWADVGCGRHEYIVCEKVLI